MSGCLYYVMFILRTMLKQLVLLSHYLQCTHTQWYYNHDKSMINETKYDYQYEINRKVTWKCNLFYFWFYEENVQDEIALFQGAHMSM